MGRWMDGLMDGWADGWTPLIDQMLHRLKFVAGQIDGQTDTDKNMVPITRDA